MEEDFIMTPIGVLTVEHLLIARMVNLVNGELEKIAQGKKPDLLFIDGAIDFAKTYADACHHGKEEDRLFPLLEKRGVPMRGCPVEALIHEHGAGRALVKGLAEAVVQLDARCSLFTLRHSENSSTKRNRIPD